MANEVRIARQQSSLTLYFAVRDGSGDVWNGSTFTAIGSVTWTAAAIDMSEQGSSGDYYGNFPGGISGGIYTIEVFQRLGSSEVRKDDTILATAEMIWRGSRLLTINQALGEMVEDDSGTVRLTEDALAEAASGGSSVTNDSIADAVWNESRSGHSEGGSFGETMASLEDRIDNLDAAITSRSSHTAGDAADAVWDEGVNHDIVGTYGEIMDRVSDNIGNLNALITSRASQTSVNTIDAIVDDILLDTDELQTDWANGGRLDVILDATATGSDLATVAGYVDTEVQAIKDVTDKLDTALELDGAVWRWTENSLELAPTGDGGGGTTDWTTAEREQIRNRLGIDGDANAPAATPSLATQASVDTIDGIVDAILLDTDELQTDWADGGRLDLILDARASQTSVNTIDGIVDEILLDTGELQTDWADGGRLDVILDATATGSDLATVAGYVDTEVQAIKDVTDKLDTGLELDGAVWRWTENSLELAPTGDGGGGTTDWTTAEREQIRHQLGIDGDSSAPAATPSLASQASVDTIDGIVDAILADTDELQGDWANGGRLDSILDARASQASVDTVDGIVDAILLDTDELQGDWANGGRLDSILDARASQASVDTVDGIVDAILLDTAELQTDWADGGRLDLILDARASQASVDALAGASAIADAVRTELATELGRIDAAVSTRSTLTEAQVNLEVDNALADIGLDHLVAAAVNDADVADNSLFGRLGSKTGDWSTFDQTTDSLEGIRDNMAGADVQAVVDGVLAGIGGVSPDHVGPAFSWRVAKDGTANNLISVHHDFEGTLAFDFSALINPGQDLLGSITATISPSIDDVPSDLLFSPDRQRVHLNVADLASGTTYTVRCTTQTTDSQLIVGEGRLLVT